MSRTLSRLAATLVALLTVLAATACSGPAGSSAPATSGKLKIGVSPVPHAEILKFVKDNLARDAGLDLEIVEFNDYVQPNEALKDKSLDANYFQHKPYLEDQSKTRGYQFSVVTPVHLEPLGVYSKKVKSLSELKEGATVAIPNDASNGGRALKLLAAQGVITLKDAGAVTPSVRDIATNPKKLKFAETEAAQLPRSLADVDAAVINGNYAIGAQLSPTKDALALEKADNNPYANVLVTRADNANDPRFAKLKDALCSEKTKQFIKDKYAGAVVPAC